MCASLFSSHSPNCPCIVCVAMVMYRLVTPTSLSPWSLKYHISLLLFHYGCSIPEQSLNLRHRLLMSQPAVCVCVCVFMCVLEEKMNWHAVLQGNNTSIHAQTLPAGCSFILQHRHKSSMDLLCVCFLFQFLFHQKKCGLL